LYELHPHSIEGLDTFSTVLWQLKDEKALNQLSRRAVSLAPSRAETGIATGNLFSLQHNTDVAIQMFQRAAAPKQAGIIRASWNKMGFGYESRDSATSLAINESKIRQSPGLREIWEFDYQPTHLTEKRLSQKWRWSDEHLFKETERRMSGT
jgi:anaphase-promoting complex subunit 3